jgi:hypothetical protein
VRNNRFVCLASALSLLIAFAAGGEQDLVIDEYDVALAQAARNNNFPEFDRLYQRNPLPPYAELHRLWSWAMSDPIGGFYGRQTYEQLAAAYPAYADFIAEHRIVDSNQNVFYPTAETRTFLLSQAIRGVVAEVRPVQREVARPKPAAVVASVKKTVAPAVEKAPLTTAAIQTPRPATVKVQPVVVAAQPVVAPVVAPAPRPIPHSRSARTDNDLGRGIFLIIAGLIGVGTVSLMLHTSPEERGITQP